MKVISLFIFAIMLSTAAQASVFNEDLFVSASAALTNNSLHVASNSSGSEMSSEGQSSFALRGLARYYYNRAFTFTGGLSVESVALRLRQKVAGFEAEFDDQSYLLGLPIGAHISPIRSDHLYFPVYFVPKLKLSEQATVAKCSGLCRAEPTMKSVLNFIEFGVGWEQSSWDFQFIVSQGLSKQFENDSSDLRIASVVFSAGYLW